MIIKRDRRYKDGRPHEAVETEAISQRVLIDILRDWLDALLPEPLTRVQEREEVRPPAKAVGATRRVDIMQDVVVHQHAAIRQAIRHRADIDVDGIPAHAVMTPPLRFPVQLVGHLFGHAFTGRHPLTPGSKRRLSRCANTVSD